MRVWSMFDMFNRPCLYVSATRYEIMYHRHFIQMATTRSAGYIRFEVQLFWFCRWIWNWEGKLVYYTKQIHGSKPGQERVQNLLTLGDDITWFPSLFLSFLEISKQSCIRFYEFLFSKQIYVFYFRSGTCFHSLSGSRCSDAFSSLVVCPVFHHVVLAGSGQWGKL